MMPDERVLAVLSQRPGWAEAVTRLRQKLMDGGEQPRRSASAYAEVYKARRAAMVVDVIASRQRRYESRVAKIVKDFENVHPAATLLELASLDELPGLGLRDGEADTMIGVSRGLCRFGSDTGGGEDDEVVARWAAWTEGLDIAHRLDPYVGSVKGIGPALFCYLRMRSGGDGLKPDVRVREALRDLGFDPPGGEVALLVLGHALAAEIDETRLVLDQLLWS